MAEYIEREAAIEDIRQDYLSDFECRKYAVKVINRIPTADVMPVVRCQYCKHSIPFDAHCELNSSAYLHCALWRGEECKNVWHKYKKYYKDYSVVDRFEDFCSSGERMDGET